MDVIAHKLVEPGQPALDLIVESFGPEFLFHDGKLDRKKMKNLIFSNHDARKKLEHILHPLIREYARAQIRRLKTPYCTLVVPLYGASKEYDWVDHVLVVDTSEEVSYSIGIS